MNNKKSFLTILICALSFGIFGTSCSDMLEPNMDRYSDNYAKDSVYSAFGILMSIQDVAERTVILDASRSDLVTTGVYTTDSIMELVNFENPEDKSSALLNVSDYYHIINSCNFYIAKVDTVSSKNGYVEMSREYAEIATIRAWAYLQLINVYGSVPYITKPISSVDDAEKYMASSPKISKDNVADLFEQSNMLRVFEIQAALGLPSNYSSVKISSSTSYSTAQMFFPVELVMGDAYLMQNKYQRAAEMYFHYFNNSDRFSTPYNATMNSSYKFTISEHGTADNKYFDLNGKTWLSAFSANSNREKLVLSVGAQNSEYGKVMTSIQQVFGFKTSSSHGAKVSITANNEYQQLLPSESYISLNRAQNFNRYQEEEGVETVETIEDCGDARLYAAAPIVEFANGERTRIIDKCAPVSTGTVSMLSSASASQNNFTMVYDIPLYRNPVVWLRYAEAINRMGFPETAFGVLKDGLSRQNLPNYEPIDQNIYIIDTIDDRDDGATEPVWRYDTTAVVKVTIVDGVEKRDTLEVDWYHPLESLIDTSLLHVPTFVPPVALNGGCYYVSVEETQDAENYPEALGIRQSLRFSNLTVQTNGGYYGIHGRGCGDVGGHRDTLYTYARMVAKKIAENYARANNLTYDQQLAYEETLHSGDTLLVTDKDLIMNAVEDLIVDEGALESAFESNRFTDLMRIANHKTQAGLVDGTQWLAWKVARRNNKVTDAPNLYDAALFSKLSNQKNWYFSLPEEEK